MSPTSTKSSTMLVDRRKPSEGQYMEGLLMLVVTQKNDTIVSNSILKIGNVYHSGQCKAGITRFLLDQKIVHMVVQSA